MISCDRPTPGAVIAGFRRAATTCPVHVEVRVPPEYCSLARTMTASRVGGCEYSRCPPWFWRDPSDKMTRGAIPNGGTCCSGGAVQSFMRNRETVRASKCLSSFKNVSRKVTPIVASRVNE